MTNEASASDDRTAASPGQHATDEALATAAAADRPLAFEALARRYQVPLLRFLMRSTGNLHDAEDALQETLRRLYTARRQFLSGHRYRPWAFAVARRVAIDAAHHRTRQRLLQEAAKHEPQVGHPLTAAEAAMRAEAYGSVWELARRLLTQEQHEALWLFYVEELPATQIADVMGRSWVSTKAMLMRARRRLQHELAQAAESDPRETH